MAYMVRITVQVVNEDGDVMNTRGNPSFLNKTDRLECHRTLPTEFQTVEQGRYALNQVWGFVNPIEAMLAKSNG